MIIRRAAVAYPFRGEAFSWGFSFDQKLKLNAEPIADSIHQAPENQGISAKEVFFLSEN